MASDRWAKNIAESGYDVSEYGHVRRGKHIFMNKLSTKAFAVDFEVKATDEHPGGEISGYASTWDGPDLANETVMQGAFAKTLREQKSVPILDSHSAFGSAVSAIGRTIEMREDVRGLFFKAFLATTERAQEIRKLIKEGVIDRLSIGYSVIKETVDRATGHRKLLELALFEISPVIFPANPAAVITGAKNGSAAVADAGSVLAETQRILAELKKNNAAKAQTKKPMTGAEACDVMLAIIGKMRVRQEIAHLNEEKRVDTAVKVLTEERVQRLQEVFGRRCY